MGDRPISIIQSQIKETPTIDTIFDLCFFHRKIPVRSAFATAENLALAKNALKRQILN
jgi:hypothetical protein